MPFQLCTKENFLVGLSFEHDAIMRLLGQQRCDKLIIIVSRKFFQDNLTQFITRYAQALQICKWNFGNEVSFIKFYDLSDDNKKIIPCAREDYGIAYNLKGYSVLSTVRCGRLFNFWDRLKSSLEEGKMMRFDVPKNLEFSEFTLEEHKNENNENSFKNKVKKIFTSVKNKVKRVKIKGEAWMWV